ncbi:hypothetical protein NL108_016198 [Boleophthalmus pectinirostris]|nr:hypothetical protein NL108_016198 [Boleophthalmus pectinirostris]
MRGKTNTLGESQDMWSELRKRAETPPPIPYRNSREREKDPRLLTPSAPAPSAHESDTEFVQIPMPKPKPVLRRWPAASRLAPRTAAPARPAPTPNNIVTQRTYPQGRVFFSNSTVGQLLKIDKKITHGLITCIQGFPGAIPYQHLYYRNE